MKTAIQFFGKSVMSLFALLTIISFTAFSQNNPAGNQTGALAYNYPVNKPVKYRTTTKVVQDMDVNGQSMQNNINSYIGLTLKSLGAAGSNFKIEVTIDTMAQTTDTPAGFNGGAIPGIAGKVYNIIISPDGKVIDNSEAKNITYAAGAGGTGDAVQITDNFFPVLPAGNLKSGYTWTTNDSINSTTSLTTTRGTVNSDNTFEGFELLNGVSCAKITSVISGTRILRTQSQGMDIKMSGPYTGSITSFFAPSTGYFMKQEVSQKLTGTIDITAPDAMSFPLVMDITAIKEVIN
ncbi:MAG: hypothetical protein ABSA76_10225 [Bacteroidales bacterium]